jgi:hypothetical protein
MRKTLLVIAVAVTAGYVFGTKAGRERYNALVESLGGIWQDPRVAQARHDAVAYAREQAPVIRDRAQAAVKGVADKSVGATKDLTDRTVTVAKGAAERTAAVAKDATDKTMSVARDATDKTVSVAKDAADRTVSAATDAATRVGEARDNALEDFDDDEE